ncbi:alpha-L-fucosidase [Actinacidiphila paucisporea]|uniref:alpha-L-fucosidase n=2 Tax=Actinacidiphila paucisporea TaxID=310782 RepID=A0A1M7NGG6_9ACTN|nr:alpha-L-fucosidase [Actinacidiphila paucisporea]
MSSVPMSRRSLIKAAALAGGTVAFGLPQFLDAAPAAAYTVPAKMDWWYQARFGMFIHFGSYSYLGHGEWAFTNENWAKANYQTQVSAHFNPTSFNAATTATLAANAGMKYLVITAKHHEGFAMWDSGVPGFTDTTGTKSYNLHDYTAYQGDLLASLKTECEARGVKFGLYYSILDWNHPSQTDRGGLTTMSSLSARSAYIADMKAQLQELLDRYDPAVLWFDGDWFGEPAGPTLNDWWLRADGLDLYNWLIARKPGLVVNERVKRNLGLGDFMCPEQTVPAAPLSRPWETCATMNGAWGYNSGSENSYRSVADIVRELVTVVSRDGNYLLNIGPKGDGTVTAGSVTILQGLASWMSTYGDSVHGTTASPYATDPSWGRATKKDGTLYAHVFTWPADGRLQIPALTNTVSRVYLMNNPSASLPYTVSGGQINVTVPTAAPNAADSVVCVAVTGVPSTTSSTTVFQDTGYAGGHAVLALGGYTAAQLSAAGSGPSLISSLRVPSGYQVTGYSGDNFTGTAWAFTADAPDLRQTGNNDAIVSLKVAFNPSAYFRLVNVTDGLALDSGGSVPAGSNLKQWTPVDSTNVQWQAIDLGTGYYRLVNRTNGMAADGGGTTTSGDPARQSAWTGSPNQQWQITDRGAGRYSVANRATGLVLDGGGSVPSGSVCKQWPWQDSPNLLWTFQPVG